jgi:hypothetical protein
LSDVARFLVLQASGEVSWGRRYALRFYTGLRRA